METNYSLSWKQYCKGNNYKTLVNAMSSNGLEQPYIDNILKDAFEAGWNATGTEIKECLGVFHISPDEETVTFTKA